MFFAVIARSASDEAIHSCFSPVSRIASEELAMTWLAGCFAGARHDGLGCLTSESVTRHAPNRHRPARPGDPVIPGVRNQIETSRITGSPACAGDDGLFLEPRGASLRGALATKQSTLSLRHGLLRFAMTRRSAPAARRQPHPGSFTPDAQRSAARNLTRSLIQAATIFQQITGESPFSPAPTLDLPR
jgi:hypothetical protein